MNWSIVRVAEWLLARDFEQYISAYKKDENSKYYEINDIDDIDDIATEYLLKRTLDIGHGAICTEGTKETSKDFYKAYYKMNDINNNYVLSRLELDFNKIYDFSFYDINAKGYVRAINKKLLDITDDHIIPTPSVTPTKSDPYEQYLVELEQLKIDEARNNAKSERRQNKQLTGTYKEFVEITKDVINRLEHTIEQQEQEQDIDRLSDQLKKQADKHLYDWQAMNKNQYPPELHLAMEIWGKYYQAGEIEYITQFNTGKFNRIANELNLKEGNLKDRIRTLLTPLVRKLKAPSLIESFDIIDIIHTEKLEQD